MAGYKPHRAVRTSAASWWELLNLGSPDGVRWMRDGLCAQTDPDAFFPGKGEPTGPAKAVCLACPVRTECLAYALDRDERFGVWGGTSPRERRALLRRTAQGVAA
jgi:WhiB family transcriptional regulator, redox-sensing transcriptional regulator